MRRKNSVAEDEEKEYNQKKKDVSFGASLAKGASALGNTIGNVVSTTISKPKEVSKNDAEKMVDYLYDEKNISKTQDFLFNNDFPSYEDREYNKEFYGEKEEKEQTVDNFRKRANSVLNPSLPNSFDRDFRKGLMGDEEEERDYNKQVADNKKAKSDYAFAFRGSPFEHLFAEPQNPPAGMPLKKQDPVAELMAKAEQYQKNNSADTTASKPDSEITKEPTMWFENGDYAATHSDTKWELHPAPQSMNNTQKGSPETIKSTIETMNGIGSSVSNATSKVLDNFNVVKASKAVKKVNSAAPGSIDINVPVLNGDPIDVRFTFNDGKFYVRGKKHLLKKYADDKIISKAIEAIDGFEIPEIIRPFFNSADDFAKLKKGAKYVADGTDIAGIVIDVFDILSTLQEDVKQNTKPTKTTFKKIVSVLGKNAFAEVGSAAGVKLGLATAVANPIAGVVVGILSSILLDVGMGELGENLIEKAFDYIDENVF